MKLFVLGLNLVFCVVLNCVCLASQETDKADRLFIENIKKAAKAEARNILQKHELTPSEILEGAKNEQLFTLAKMKGGISKSLEDKGMAVVYIEFPSGKASVDKTYAPILDEICAVLKKNEKWKLRIEGHTDKMGKPDWNRKLSLKRAEAVGAELVKKGISPSRLSYMGCGSDCPIDESNTSAAHAKNRRVELHRW